MADKEHALMPESELDTVESYRDWYRRIITTDVPTSRTSGLHDCGFPPDEARRFNSSLHHCLKVQSNSDHIFRYISGSGLRSPRCRYDGVACIVLRYFRSTTDRPSWYLIRTARTQCLRDGEAGTRSRFIRFQLVRNLHDANRSASFDWVLRDRPEAVTTTHFETYAPTDDDTPCDHVISNTCRRYAVIVGPPSIGVTPGGDDQEPMPMTCLVDLERQTIEFIELKLFRTGRRTWPTVATFDPRESRDHVAAVICCQRSYSHLPRDVDISDTTASVALIDFRSRRIIRSYPSVSGRAIQTGRLQYVANGNHLLILIASSSSSNESITSGLNECSAVLLSADDLSPLCILPFRSGTLHRTIPEVDWPFLSSHIDTFVLFSEDSRKLVLVCCDGRRKRLDDVVVSRDDVTNAFCGGRSSGFDSREFPPASVIDGNNNETDTRELYSMSRHIDTCVYCEPLIAAVYRIGRHPMSLARICAAVIVKVVPSARIDELPLPLAVQAELKKSRHLHYNEVI